MVIDIVYLIFLAIGIWQGFKKGIIETIFGVTALFLGILISVKFSHDVSLWLREFMGWKTKLLPFITLILLLGITLLIIRFVSKLIENMAQEIQLGFFNKLFGSLLWCLVLSVIFSVIIWLLNQMHVLPEGMKTSSLCYSYLVKLAPETFEFLGGMLPYFKGIFDSLRDFLTEKPA
jgi:membrane protein required for colicin V production